MSDAALAPRGDLTEPEWMRKAASQPVERLPLFAKAMTAVADLWTDSFCILAATEGEISFQGLQGGAATDLVAGSAPPILTALRVPSWHCAVAVAVDRGMLSTVVEALFGGGDETTDMGTRPLSQIETRIVDVLGGQAAAALTGGLKGIHPTRFEFDRTMPKPDPSFLGKPPPPLLLATFRLRVVGRTASLVLAFPTAAVEAQGAVWGGDAAATPPPDETTWSRNLQNEVSRATLRIEASVSARSMSLRAIAGLKVGQIIELPPATASSVLLHCGDERLFRCALGQSEGYYTVRVDEPLERQAQSPRKGR